MKTVRSNPKSRVKVLSNGCHEWTGSKNSKGYGRFYDEDGRFVMAHIHFFEEKYGPVPEGLQLDHFKCNWTSCCNPDHVRAVTLVENLMRSNAPCAVNARKKECKKGHPFNKVNTHIRPCGRRQCIACRTGRTDHLGAREAIT